MRGKIYRISFEPRQYFIALSTRNGSPGPQFLPPHSTLKTTPVVAMEVMNLVCTVAELVNTTLKSSSDEPGRSPDPVPATYHQDRA